VGFLELIGALRRSPGTRLTDLVRLRSAAAVIGLAVAGSLVPAARAAAAPMRPTDMRCIEGCAGGQTAAAGSTIRITGDGLKQVAEVDFRGRTRWIAAKPKVAGSHRVAVEVPPRARSGRPRVAADNGRAVRVRELLRVVSPQRLPERGSFDLLDSDIRPRTAFVDGGRTFKLRYRFRAFGPVNVRTKLLHGGNVLRRWANRKELPYTAHRLRWKGMLSAHHPAPPGHYRFKIKAPGRKPELTPEFRLFSGKFPVRGPHDYGGPVQRFGAPRSGGRVHQGQDVFAVCGTRVVAARGGHVQARGSDPVLYGNWIVIDASGTRTDYRYAHFLRPASVHDGERVRTGEEVGRIGRTGNARSVGCMLHFEVWPHGWNRDSPVDPLPILKRWDGWS
jgi:murein DD-endopeptidase MepM/ murein hydrolase activator NlpD